MAWFFLLGCFFLLAYIVVGYPLLLSGIAKKYPRPVLRSKEFRPAISVLIAVHNGEAFLKAKLDSLLTCGYPPELLQIIVASDGSTDATAAFAESYRAQGVQLLQLPKGGKPAALNAAVQCATHPVLLFTDVRQTLAPSSLERLMDCLADQQVGVVSGYLVIRPGSQEQENVGLYWRYERWIRANLSTVDSMLGATGAFYAMRRELFQPMPPDLLVDDMFLPLHAFFRGYRLIIEPSAVIYDIPTGIEAEFRRKVRTLAGNFQIMFYFPQLFSGKNRMRWHFLSYKFGRLLLPWLSLGALVSSACLPYPWRTLALIPQLVVYGLAGIDSLVSEGSPIKRLSSPARTVVGMLFATACAISICFVPATSLWKPSSLPSTSPPRKGSRNA